jgi:hypothetical protein
LPSSPRYPDPPKNGSQGILICLFFPNWPRAGRRKGCDLRAKKTKQLSITKKSGVPERGTTAEMPLWLFSFIFSGLRQRKKNIEKVGVWARAQRGGTGFQVRIKGVKRREVVSHVVISPAAPPRRRAHGRGSKLRAFPLELPELPPRKRLLPLTYDSRAQSRPDPDFIPATILNPPSSSSEKKGGVVTHRARAIKMFSGALCATNTRCSRPE